MGFIFLCHFLNGKNQYPFILTKDQYIRIGREGGNNARMCKKIGGAESESKNYIGVFGVQTAQLQHHEEQEKRSRQT